MSSSYGNHLRVSIFGQSHSEAIGSVVDGLPAGEAIDLEEVRRFMRRRAPGQNAHSTARKEADEPRVVGGLAGGFTCGAPLCALIENTNARSGDYDSLKNRPRPSHADYTAFVKYQGFADARGGGHFSGRLTAPLCFAGAVALQILARRGVTVGARIAEIAGVCDGPAEEEARFLSAREKEFPVADDDRGAQMREAIAAAKREGDSVGGVVEARAHGLPAGLGEPMFGGMENVLWPHCLFGIPAVRGLEFGAGFAAAQHARQRAQRPLLFDEDGRRRTAHQPARRRASAASPAACRYSCRAAFKPTPVHRPRAGNRESANRARPKRCVVGGRHDPCIVPRAVPVRGGGRGPGDSGRHAVTFDREIATAKEGEAPMELKDYRAKIDEIDAQIAHLFAERMQAAEAIADYKAQNHLPIYHPAREREVLLSASQAAAPYSREARVVFGAMMDVSRSRQAARLAGESPLTQAISRAVAETPATFPQNATVACQGIEGAYSHQAANRLFALPQILFFQRFDGVFQAVEKGLCRYGVLPIENSSAGSVTEVYDLMKGRDFSIVRGTRLHIVHALLTRGAKLGQIREVISHEQAVRQCAPFLKAHPEIRVTLCANTAVAAQTVANSSRDDLAAIASPACAEIYGLTALPDSIQASDNNHTRFIVISKKPEIYPGANRISLMLTLPHVAGSLYRMIARFSALEMNLLKIESRPIPGRDFEFMFYFDVEASCANPEVLSLLAELESTVSQFAFLGNYAEV